MVIKVHECKIIHEVGSFSFFFCYCSIFISVRYVREIGSRGIELWLKEEKMKIFGQKISFQEKF